jgi:dTMP kinase
MAGLFITFEGTEGGGKSTQVARLAERLSALQLKVRQLREPGGTPIGEEIRHTLKHSMVNQAMAPETELLLMNASRAQLVREIILPALESGEVVLCDRFHDSTVAYQGYGRGLDLKQIDRILEFATGGLKPDLTFFLRVPIEVSEARRATRGSVQRDRFEEADRDFFQRVERGYEKIAARDSERVKVVDATRSIAVVENEIWHHVEPLLANCLPADR